MFFWWSFVFFAISNIISTNASDISIDSDGGYKNIVVGMSPNLKKIEVESLLYQLLAFFRNASAALFTSSDNKVFFKEVTFAVPKEYKTWITNANFDLSDTKSFREPQMFVTNDDIFHNPYTIQHRGCGKPGLKINIPDEFLLSSADRKAFSLVRQWAQYRYGVFSESGFSNDSLYPACYRIPGSDNIRISDCTNEKGVYEFEKNNLKDYENFPNSCYPKPISSKNDHIVSSLMTNYDFPQMTFFCDSKTRPHNRNVPTKQNALCREKSTWEIISSHGDFKIKSKGAGNVKPAFKYVLESNPSFVVAVDTSTEMDLNGRMSSTLNAFSYFIFYDLPFNSTVRLIDMKDKSTPIIEKNILSEDGAQWLIGMFPEIGKQADTCVHCTIQRILEVLKLDINDIIVITATDIAKEWIDNTMTMLKSNKVALHVIYFEKSIARAPYLEKIAKSSGGSFFYVPDDAFLSESSVSSLTILYEAFRSVYESFSWMHRKHVLVDQMTFPSSSTKCVLSFPSDRTIENLQVIITGPEFGRNSPILRSSIALDNGVVRFVSGNDSFVYKSEVPAYIITVPNPQTGVWNLTFERKSGFSQPVVAIVRASSRDYGDVINMQAWVSKDNSNIVGNSARPDFTIFSEIKRQNNPVSNVKVHALVYRAGNNTQSNQQDTFELVDTIELKDNGDGDPDITRYDGIFSRYLTDIGERGYYSITVVAEKNSSSTNFYSENEKRKEINCCGSFIPESLSFDSGAFKRIKTYQSFFVDTEDIGKIYPPRRVVDLRIDRIEKWENNRLGYVLTWTAPGGNYDKGKVSSYNIRVFNTREDALSDFDNSYVTIITMFNIQGPLLIPEEAGTVQSAYIELTNLTSGNYFMALKTSHSGKTSDVSNVVELSYTELYPVYTATGFSNGEYYTFPIYGTTTEINTENESKEALSNDSNFGLIIGLTCALLFLLILAGLILFFYFERRRKKKSDQNPSPLGQNAKMTESSDALCRSNADGNISIISPVNSWGADSLISHYQTVQRQKTTEDDKMLTIPENRDSDTMSLSSTKYSYDNKIDINSSIYDPIYYHQARSQEELHNYSYNPTYTPYDPTYTSSMRRLENNDITMDPYALDNISYCSYSLNRNQLSRLKTDV